MNDPARGRQCMFRDRWQRCIRACAVSMGICGAALLGVQAQEPVDAQHDLKSQVVSMQGKLKSAQQQIDADHAELTEMREEIEALKKLISPSVAAGAESSTASALEKAVADIEEQQAIHQAQIQMHEQEKVETAYKYALKLHGLLLFNASENTGRLDQPTLPATAIPAGAGIADGSLTATGRQTLLGFAATGPDLWGAHTMASLDVDFSGSSTAGGYAGVASLARLRTAEMRLVWPRTQVDAGVAPLILTPYYATSYFSIAQPAFSWSGSLWAWLPQVSVSQQVNLSDSRRVTLTSALVDVPNAGTESSAALGAVSAGEQSRYPGSEFRVGLESGQRARQSVGIGGYWSPHAYGAYGSFDAWAGTLDWKLSLPAHLEFAGAAYTGSALGGLSGGAYKDFVPVGTKRLDGYASVRGLRDAGGWTQVKFKPRERFEMNGAFGLDNADSRQLRSADSGVSDAYSGLARNQTTLVNGVYRPYAAILFSVEYRRIHSWQITGPGDAASLYGVALGYEF